MSTYAPPVWLKTPTASEDPTLKLGIDFQAARDDLRRANALVQSPDFIVDFILDRTLTPAIATFELFRTTLIDPACGPGNFLCAAYMRLASAWWQLKPPGTSLSQPEQMGLAQIVLEQVAGVDIDPDCTDLARQRLGILADEFAGIAPDTYPWRVHVACADSLLHGPDSDAQLPGPDHTCDDRDCEQARWILGTTYAAVVANPPYIQANRMGPAKNAAYRARYRTCHGQYSLAVPFMELSFLLAHPGPGSS